VTLPLPPFADPKAADRVFRVPYEARAREAREWAREHGIRDAVSDSRRVGLLLVDVQNTFCLPEHELFVAGRSGRGAIEDNERLVAFLYRHLDLVTEVVVTLDTHSGIQVFHAAFWIDRDGGHPAPHTVVTVDDVKSGRWRVNPSVAEAVAPRPGFDVETWARHYVRRLDEGGKYPLVIWPYHAMLGGIGHALVSVVEESVFVHQIARQAPARVEVKGRHPLTENYSVLRPEVTEDAAGETIALPNGALVEHLLAFDALIVAGQARSHCVAWTVEDLLTAIRSRDPGLARRIYLLDDCSSPVVVPGVVDFTDPAEAAYARFAEAGMHRVLSTVDPNEWPGFPAR